MIDPVLTDSQFADLDHATVARLIAAVEDDLATWTNRLADAAMLDQADGVRRARHALTGLCSAFGANALQQACAGPLTAAEDRAALANICAATIAAIRKAAG